MNTELPPLPGPWHDRYFKYNFQTPEQVCVLLQIVFNPLLLALFDLDTLCLRPNSMPKPGSLTEFVSDLLVSVRLKDGDEVGIHLLIEHKSAPDRRLMFQLAKYTISLHENKAELLVPITLYHGRADWQPHSFADEQYAGQPAELMEHIGHVLLNIGHFFVNLRKESVQALLRQLPLQPALALEIMAYVWGADALQYAKWMERAARLESSVRGPFIDATKEYLWRVRPSIKMSQVRQLMQQTKQPGDEDMQEAIDMWEKHQPDSAEEVWTIALEKGKLLGREEGIHRMAVKMARRLIEDGSSDADIQRYTDLSPAEIRKLRQNS